MVWSLRLSKTVFVSAGTVSLNEFITLPTFLLLLSLPSGGRGRSPSVGKPKEITRFSLIF